MTQLLDDLKAVRELLSVPERWTKGAYARAGKRRASPLNNEVTCWCLLGAIRKVTGGAISSRRVQLAAAALHRATLSPRLLNYWNDDPDRTYTDIVLVIDKAIAAEEGRS